MDPAAEAAPDVAKNPMARTRSSPLKSESRPASPSRISIRKLADTPELSEQDLKLEERLREEILLRKEQTRALEVRPSNASCNEQHYL
jgi:hypothetical protein